MEKTTLKRSLIRFKTGKRETRTKPVAEKLDRLLPILYNMTEAFEFDKDEEGLDPRATAESKQLLEAWGIKKELVPYEKFVDEQVEKHAEVNKASLLGSRICRRCGRHLSNAESIARGVGPVCAGKARKGGS